MEVATINRVLGQRAGVLSLVFRLLPARDLLVVLLVCRLWREAGEAPGLWAGIVLRHPAPKMALSHNRSQKRVKLTPLLFFFQVLRGQSTFILVSQMDIIGKTNTVCPIHYLVLFEKLLSAPIMRQCHFWKWGAG